MVVEQTVFKGKPVLTLKRNETDRFPFTFGVSKAKLMLENIKAIEAFVASNSGKGSEMDLI